MKEAADCQINFQIDVERNSKEQVDSNCYCVRLRKTLKLASSITGFRLPKTMLAAVDSFCAKQDVTRSQIFRRSIVEYLKTPNAPTTAEHEPA